MVILRIFFDVLICSIVLFFIMPPPCVSFEFRTAEHAADFISALVKSVSLGANHFCDLTMSPFGYYVVTVTIQALDAEVLLHNPEHVNQDE